MSDSSFPAFEPEKLGTQIVPTFVPNNALVTGANRGIGLAVSRTLAELGTHVILAGRDEAAVLREELVLVEDGFDVESIVLDVADLGSVRAAAERLRAGGMASLDVLVNNAGTFEAVPAEDMNWTNIEPMLRVNAGGAANVIHEFLPELRAAATPRIINVSSATASMALLSNDSVPAGEWRRRAGYTVSKAALNMLTAQYATMFRRDERYAHLVINSVAPPYTASRMNNFLGDNLVESAARLIAGLVRMPVGGPTGAFFGESGSLPW